MKSLLYSTLLVVVIGMALGSCVKKEPVTEIYLPASSLVGKSLPKISGSLAEYIDIPTGSYVLDFHDSIPRMVLKFRVAKAKEVSSLITSEILADSTYVALMDSLNNDIPGFILKVDTAQLQTLNKLLETEGVFCELTFTGDKVTEGFKDTLANNACNLHLYGAVGVHLKESDIDAYLNQWKRLLGIMGNCVVPPAFVPGMYITTYHDAYRDACNIKRLLENYSSMMSDKQKKEFDSLNTRLKHYSHIG